jgi:hypothetical protein
LTEQEFASSFHAKFPYLNKEAASVLIQKGWSISPNAAFCVLHEICRPPFGTTVQAESLHLLTREWSKAGDHPLKRSLVGAAVSIIDGDPLPWPTAIDLMHAIGANDGYYAALAIAYFAGDCSTDEGNEALEKACKAIKSRWDGD